MVNEYLDICEEYPVLVVPKVVRQHLKNMVVCDTKVCVYILSFSRKAWLICALQGSTSSMASIYAGDWPVYKRTRFQGNLCQAELACNYQLMNIVRAIPGGIRIIWYQTVMDIHFFDLPLETPKRGRTAYRKMQASVSPLPFQHRYTCDFGTSCVPCCSFVFCSSPVNEDVGRAWLFGSCRSKKLYIALKTKAV